MINFQGQLVVVNSQLDHIQMQEWHTILYFISSISFTHNFDKIAWKWEASEIFSFRSLHKFLNFRGIAPIRPMLWWSLSIPYKIRIFMWLLTKNKILTKVKLHSKGWRGSTQCHLCSGIEDVNHFFSVVSFCTKNLVLDGSHYILFQRMDLNYWHYWIFL